ncbi:MAG: hypothetical protein ACKV22_18775 [Bryobacteraceae bacterium]
MIRGPLPSGRGSVVRFLLMLFPAAAFGQCSMCFRTAAALTAHQQQALNLGILVLMIPPLAILGALVYRAARSSEADPVSPEHNERDAP